MMVAPNAMQSLSADEEYFLFECVNSPHRRPISRRAVDSDVVLVPDWIVIGGREPARNSALRKDKIRIAR